MCGSYESPSIEGTKSTRQPERRGECVQLGSKWKSRGTKAYGQTQCFEDVGDQNFHQYCVLFADIGSKPKCYTRHCKEWESEVNKEGARYHKLLYTGMSGHS